MEYTEEKLNEVIKNLPQSIQKAVLSNDFVISVQEIGASQDLYIWQTGALEQECQITFLGLHKSSDFRSNLIKILEIDQKKAEEIQKEVNEKIFMPMRHLMVQKTAEVEAGLSKEDILNEIENPSTDHSSQVEFNRMPAEQDDLVSTPPTQEDVALPGTANQSSFPQNYSMTSSQRL